MKRRSIRGSTMVEVLTASVMSFLVLTGATAALIFGMSSWTRGQARIDSETQSQQAIRMVSKMLREAMVVVVDGDGQGLTYRLPTKGGDGRFTLPATWDGVTRRIEANNGKLNLVVGGSSRTLCRNVILTDPKNSNAAYRVFTPGAGAITRQLWMMLATSNQSGDRARVMKSRGREMIYLRNIPQLAN